MQIRACAGAGWRWGWEFSLGRVRAFEVHIVGAQVGPRGMAGLERGSIMGTHMPAQESEWRAANGGGGPEPSQSEVVQEHHGLWRLVSLGGDFGGGSVLREMGVTRGRVWETGGPRRVGGPSTGDLGWAELGLVSSSRLGRRGRRSALGPQEGLRDPAVHHTQSVGMDPEALFRVVLPSTHAVRGGRVEDADPILLL